VCGSGEEMAVVRPDFVESGFNGGDDVDRVTGTKRRRFGEASSKEFNLAEDVIRYRNQPPSFVRKVVQEKIRQFRRGFRLERTFPNLTVKRARKFGNT
jgi:hypothetical protein